MNKQEILATLKRNCGSNSIKLPSDIEFNILDEMLNIKITAASTVQNMQKDSSAFEAWAVLLKRWIEEIETVSLSWDEPLFYSLSDADMLHYQRFLFRAQECDRAFSWFTVDRTTSRSLAQLVVNAIDSPFVLNSQDEDRRRDFAEVLPLDEYGEDELEEFILTHPNTTTNFTNTFSLDIVDNQLPVGLFQDEVLTPNAVFPHKKSAIDIWGINQQNEFCLFELKNSSNNKVGSLTEMFFYSKVIQKVVEGIWTIDANDGNVLQIQNANRVRCYLLAPNAHPLIDVETFHLLNGWSDETHFGWATISIQNEQMQFEINI